MEVQPVTVLLIDDDEDDFMIVREMLLSLESLESSRLDLQWVETYEAGMEAIEREAYDVYVVDYRLGERTGLDLLRQALAQGCEAPFILLTGQGDQQVDLAAMEAGAADYLVKGQVDGALLNRSIRYALARGRERGTEKTQASWRPGDLMLQAALARGAPTPEAARAASVSERTVYRRLADPHFRAEVDKLREELRAKLVSEMAVQLVNHPGDESSTPDDHPETDS